MPKYARIFAPADAILRLLKLFQTHQQIAFIPFPVKFGAISARNIMLHLMGPTRHSTHGAMYQRAIMLNVRRVTLDVGMSTLSPRNDLYDLVLLISFYKA